MADYWDDPSIWDTPANETTTNNQTQTSSTTSNTGTTTPAATNLKSKTWANMPDWYENSISSAWKSDPSSFGKFFQGTQWQDNAWDTYFKDGPRYQKQTDDMVGNLQSAWGQYQQLPGQIENKRQALINQIYANVPEMQKLYQPSMEDMSRRGILNSTVTGDALGEIQKGVNRDITGKVAEANTWAADQGINYTKDMSTVLSNLINTGLSASNQYTSQGQAAFNSATNRQQLINSLLEMLKKQGSETYNV
jgi:hypothetical protein